MQENNLKSFPKTTYQPTIAPIKTWAEEDRPREKLMLRGKRNLSNAELIAILLGSGSREETAVGLAKSILRSVDNDLDELGKVTLKDLQKFKGVGVAKAISIAAAMELGRRRQLTNLKTRVKATSSAESYRAIAPLLMDLPHEEFWILLLNQRCEILKRVQISVGGITHTTVDPKVVFRKAIEGNAVAIILVHNHPSGNLNPSQADIKLTQKLVEAGKTIEIMILDHLIIAGQNYYSFKDEGRV